MLNSIRLSFWIALCSLIALSGSGCNHGPANGATAHSHPTASKSKDVATIATTTGMVADIVRHVTGSHADVIEIIKTDPHLFKPTRGDMKQMRDADVVIYSGLMLEGRMNDTFGQLKQSGKNVFAVTESLDKEYLRSPPDFAGHYDPHVWMDVGAWSKCVSHVAEIMASVDPIHVDEFRANAQEYCEELDRLDKYVRTSIQSIPERQRVLVTAHDAFGYFSKTYGIEVKSVQGVTTESEAGVRDVNQLVDFLVERKLPAIFVESTVNSKNIEAVIEGTQSRGVTVAIGGELFSDAMGPEGTYEGTYIGMIDHNVTVITRALGGEVPERGLNGKLGEAK